MNQQHTVRAHVRSDGATVREHNRRSRGPAADIDPEASLAATQAAEQAASSRGLLDEWQERPVKLTDLSTALSAVGAGKAADIAPLVEIRQGPDGTTFTSAIMGPGEELPTGALEINDPFAVSDVEQTATVNGRFLRDAIMTRSASERNALTAGDISVLDGQVSVDGAEVIDVDGWSSGRRSAARAIDEITAGVAAEGITEENIERNLMQPRLAARGLGEGDDYTKRLAERIQGEHFNALHDAWNRYRGAVRSANGSGATPPTPEEWAAENAYECRIMDLSAVEGSVKRQAHDDYQAEMQAWAERNGHNLPALREAAMAPNENRHRAGYRGPSGDTRAGLERAQHLLAACGDTEPDRSADALGFVGELSRVLPARHDTVDRPILNSVWFHKWSKKPRMTSCDSYVLASSGVNAPASLSENNLLLSGHDLNAWAKIAGKHLGKKGGGSLMTGNGEVDAKYRLNPRWGSDRGKEPEYKTWRAPVAALQAGQVKVATQRIHGDYASIDSLIPPHQETAVTIPASSLSDIDKRGRKADVYENSPVRMTLHSENGKVTNLHWQIKGPSRSDYYDSEQRVRASGNVAPSADNSGPAPASDSVAIKPDFLATSLRFVSGGDKKADVDLRRWDPVKPMVITSAGASTDPHQTDRVSLLMPARLS